MRNPWDDFYLIVYDVKGRRLSTYAYKWLKDKLYLNDGAYAHQVQKSVWEIYSHEAMEIFLEWLKKFNIENVKIYRVLEVVYSREE